MVNEKEVLTVQNLQIAYEDHLAQSIAKSIALSGNRFLQCPENQLPSSARISATGKSASIKYWGVLCI